MSHWVHGREQEFWVERILVFQMTTTFPSTLSILQSSIRNKNGYRRELKTPDSIQNNSLEWWCDWALGPQAPGDRTLHLRTEEKDVSGKTLCRTNILNSVTPPQPGFYQDSIIPFALPLISFHIKNYRTFLNKLFFLFLFLVYISPLNISEVHLFLKLFLSMMPLCSSQDVQS